MLTKRQGIIIWFQHMKNLRQLRRYGHMIYASKKLKYTVIYVNEEQIDEVVEQIEALPFVSRVDRSYKPFIKTDYENSKPDKAKEYDYKYGI